MPAAGEHGNEAIGKTIENEPVDGLTAIWSQLELNSNIKNIVAHARRRHNLGYDVAVVKIFMPEN